MKIVIGCDAYYQHSIYGEAVLGVSSTTFTLYVYVSILS
jgi:hypothetical protein